MLRTHTTHLTLLTPKDTRGLAEECARDIHSGVTCALTGPIGAGKTTFVKALARACGIRRRVVSPTFTLLQPYTLPRARHGIKTLVHVDCYRIDDPHELLHVGLVDFLNDPTMLVVIEWAEKIKWFLENRKKQRGTSPRRELWWLDFSLNSDGVHVCDLRRPK